MPKKILIVDDDPDIRDVLTIILESRGYQVVTAQNGIEGLANLKAEKPDLMILDLLMPKMDGFGVMKELREASWAEFKNMPIMILTSVGEEPARRRYQLETAVELGMDDYVEKPIAPEALLERVENLLRQKKTA